MTATDPHLAEGGGDYLLAPGHTTGGVSDQISDVVLKRPLGYGWLLGFAVVFAGTLMLTTAIGYLIVRGVGIWGIDIPVAWGFAIVNFVWWIGIGHAGTFISAMLFLMKQDWRTSINRFAEAMTLFAVACAALFPLLHLGRIQFFYWLIPYPNSMYLWPQFRSPLVWDVFAVSTYGTVSLLFWYTGLVPDLATLRDRAKNPIAWAFFGILSLGWRGASRHWEHHQKAYLLMAGMAAPLVVSVHSIVGADFAAAQVPGWHSTIFPPYFVAGAIFSGFAMVLTLVIPVRAVYGLQNFITDRHIDNCCKLLLVTSLLVCYGYCSEWYMAWYSGDPNETFVALNRFVGPYGPAYWVMLFCNCVAPQLLWFRRVRRMIWLVFILSLLINVGMWLERFIIIITSLHRDFIISSWGMYTPTFWDWATFIGTIGMFLTLIFIFVRILPAISIFEVRELVHRSEEGPNA